MVWQPNTSRVVIKREELRLERKAESEDDGLDSARDLDALEVERRAERRRAEREAAERARDADESR